MTNGLHTEYAALRYFSRTYGMLVQLGGTHLVPGEVRCFASGNHGWLDIGCFPTGTDTLCASYGTAIAYPDMPVGATRAHILPWG